MSKTQFTLDKFKKDTSNVDPDFRYMALLDLHDAIKKNLLTVTAADEKIIVDIVSERFSPTERVKDVHTMALRTLDQLSLIISLEGTTKLVKELIKYMQTEAGTTNRFQEVIFEQQVRMMQENACHAIRIIIKNLKDEHVGTPGAATLAAVIVEGIIGLVAKQKDEIIKQQMYDVFQPLVEKLGDKLTEKHFELAYKQLRHDKTTAGNLLHQQICSAVASMFPNMTDKVFAVALGDVVADLKKSQGESFRRAIDLANAVCRTSAHRIGSRIRELFDLLQGELKRIGALDAEIAESAVHNEVRAAILQCFGHLIRHSSAINDRQSTIVEGCVELLSWDPNFCGFGDDDADDDNTYNGGGMDDDDEYGDYAIEDMGMDDDNSWKVRHAAASCLCSLLALQGPGGKLVVQKLLGGDSPVLVSRLRDRNENAKLQVFALATAVVGQAYSMTTASGCVASNVAILFGRETSQTMRPLEPAATLIRQSRARIVDTVVKCLEENNIKVTGAVVDFLRPFLAIIGGADLQTASVPVAQALIKNLTASGAKGASADILHVLRFLLREGSAAAKEAVTAARAVIGTSITDAASLVARAGVILLADIAAANATNNAVARECFASVVAVLSTPDNDARAAAANAGCAIVAKLNDRLEPSAISEMTSSLEKLLASDVTRRFTCQAISGSGVAAALAPTVVGPLESLAILSIHRADRHEREASIAVLAALIAAHPAQTPDAVIATIIKELSENLQTSTVLRDDDQGVTAAALQLATATVKARAADAKTISQFADAILKNMITFVEKSALLNTGRVMAELANFAFALGSAVAPAQFKTVIGLAETAAKSTAQNPNHAVIFGGLLAADAKSLGPAIAKLAADAGKADGAVACYTIGEIGRFRDLGEFPAALSFLLAPAKASEEIRVASIYALSRANSSPKCFAEIVKASAGANIVALKSLRTTLQEGPRASSGTVTQGGVGSIIAAVKASVTVSPTTEAMECLGLLAAWDVAAVADAVAASVSAGQFVVAAVALRTALRTAAQQSLDVAPLVAPTVLLLPKFTRQADLALRLNMLQLLRTILNENLLTEAIYNAGVPAAIAELRVDPSLISITDLGVVKHREDRGTDLRRAAFDFAMQLLEFPGTTDTDIEEFVSAAVHAVAPEPTAKTPASEEDEDLNIVAQKALLAAASSPRAQNAVFAADKMQMLAAFLKPVVIRNGTEKKNAEASEVSRYRDGIVAAIATIVQIQKKAASLGRVEPSIKEAFDAAKSNTGFYTTAIKDIPA